MICLLAIQLTISVRAICRHVKQYSPNFYCYHDIMIDHSLAGFLTVIQISKCFAKYFVKIGM